MNAKLKQLHHLIKSNKVKLLLCSLISLNLYASNDAFDEKIISEDEMNKIDAKIIKSVDVKKGDIKKEIKIITKNSSGLPEDAEIYIDGKKATKEELDKIEKEEIEGININNNNVKKSI